MTRVKFYSSAPVRISLVLHIRVFGLFFNRGGLKMFISQFITVTAKRINTKLAWWMWSHPYSLSLKNVSVFSSVLSKHRRIKVHISVYFWHTGMFGCPYSWSSAAALQLKQPNPWDGAAMRLLLAETGPKAWLTHLSAHVLALTQGALPNTLKWRLSFVLVN